MRIVLLLSPESEVVVANDKDGKPTRIEFTPIFTSPTGFATLCYFESHSNNDKQLDSRQLRVAGADGKISLRDRPLRVVAKVDEDEDES